MGLPPQHAVWCWQPNTCAVSLRAPSCVARMVALLCTFLPPCGGLVVSMWVPMPLGLHAEDSVIPCEGLRSLMGSTLCLHSGIVAPACGGLCASGWRDLCLLAEDFYCAAPMAPSFPPRAHGAMGRSPEGATWWGHMAACLFTMMVGSTCISSTGLSLRVGKSAFGLPWMPDPKGGMRAGAKGVMQEGVRWGGDACVDGPYTKHFC